MQGGHVANNSYKLYGHLDSVEWNGGLKWWNGNKLIGFHLRIDHLLIKTTFI